MLRWILISLALCLTGLVLPARGQSVTLQWDPSPDSSVVGYNVYRSTRSGTGYQRLNSSLVSAARFTDATLQYDTSFFYVCTAVNGAGLESGYSNEVSYFVRQENAAPSAQNDVAVTAEDSPLSIFLLANDSDPNGDALAVVGLGVPRFGTVSLVAGGTVLYRPGANFFGADSFTYTVSDGSGGTATGSVSVTVTPVNDVPLPETDRATTNSDTSVVIELLANDVDVDGDSLSVASVDPPANGSARLEGGTVIYTPRTDFSGWDTFAYTVVDAQGAQAVGSVMVQVIKVDPPLMAVADVTRVSEDSSILVDVTANDVGSREVPFVVTVVEPPRSGKAVTASGGVRYTPVADYFGADAFTYQIRDKDGMTSSARVSIDVTPVNDRPEARADVALTQAGKALRIDVLLNDNDVDRDPLQVTATTHPQYGTVTTDADGQLTYTPRAGFTGIDRFRYTVTDGTESSSAEVEFRVEARDPAGDRILLPSRMESRSAVFDDVFVGVALLNLQPYFDRVRLDGFGEQGENLAGVTEEAALPPGGQRAFLAAELPGGDGAAGYLAASAYSPGLEGFFMVGDYQSRRIDGIGARPASGRELFLPEADMSAESDTFIQVVNLEAKAGRVQLELYGPQSRTPVRWSGALVPSGTLRGSISDFFGYRAGVTGYLRISADVEMLAYEVVAGTEWLEALPSLAPKTSSFWMAPHIFADRQGGDTLIRILNNSILTVSATATVYNDAGVQIVSRPVYLPSRQLTTISATSLFGEYLMREGIISGSLKVSFGSSGTPPVVATVTYSSSRFRTSLPMASAGKTEAIFPQVAHSADGRIYTGLAVFNPTAGFATVTVEVYDANGNRKGVTSLRLAPNARRSELLNGASYFGPGFEQLGGHVRVTSDRPVISYLTYGDANGEFLSALESSK